MADAKESWSLSPQSDLFQQASPRPSWKTRPAWFLVAEQDRMINAETQRFMAERMQARIRSHDVDHVPLISRPQAVTDIVCEALEHASTVTESDAQ